MYTYVWEHIVSLCSTTAFLILTKLGLITHIVYNISIFTSISGGANAPLRGGGGVILLVLMENCLKCIVECFEIKHWATNGGGGEGRNTSSTAQNLPISIVIKCSLEPR